MQIVTSRDGMFPVVMVSGRLTGLETSDDLRRAVEGVVHPGDRNLIVDFSPLEYISSSGLRAVAMTVNRTRKSGIRMVIVITSPMVREVFTVSGFDQLFEIVDSNDLALVALGS